MDDCGRSTKLPFCVEQFAYLETKCIFISSNLSKPRMESDLGVTISCLYQTCFHWTTSKMVDLHFDLKEADSPAANTCLRLWSEGMWVIISYNLILRECVCVCHPTTSNALNGKLYSTMLCITLLIYRLKQPFLHLSVKWSGKCWEMLGELGDAGRIAQPKKEKQRGFLRWKILKKPPTVLAYWKTCNKTWPDFETF